MTIVYTKKHLEHPVAVGLFNLLESRKNHMHPVKGVSKYNHMCQMAELSKVDGHGPTWIVAALFHDCFGHLCPHRHGEIIADVLEPYVPVILYNVLKYHDIFMRRFWFDTHEHIHYRNRDWYTAAIRFTERDWAAFRKDYRSPPAEAYIKEINEVFDI